MGNMFSILSTQAPLVEVVGDGPTTDLRGGLVVPDGCVTIAPADLLTRTIRRWRVDAPPSVKTSVVVTDSPFGAFVGLRRRIDDIPAAASANCDSRALRLLKRVARTLATLWEPPIDPSAVESWRDITEIATNQVQARGGDLVIVHFVDVRGANA
jgi:hypothetical protein